MFNLIKKDLILQKSQSPLYLIYLILFLWVGWDVNFIIALISIMFLVNSHYYDEKDNANILLNSLPYTRREIVGSKYIGTLMHTVAIMPFCLVGEYFIVDSMQLQISLKGLVLSFVAVMIVAAFYLPFLYLIKAQYLVFIFSLLSVLIMFVVKNIPYLLNKYANSVLDFWLGFSDLQLYGILALIAGSLYGLSWILSFSIYKNKAF